MIAAEPIVLRDYQVRCVDGVHDLMRAGKKRILMVAPTGSGKRILGAWWARLAAENMRDMLFVTDRTLLVEQMAAEAHARGIDFGVIMGGYEEQRHHRVQLATIQSLDARYLAGNLADLPKPNLIIVDEAHKATEKYAELFHRIPDARVIELTATPVGPKGVTLVKDGYADVLFEGVKNSELIRDGYLLPTRLFAPSEPNVKGVRMSNGEYAEGPLGRRVAEVTCFGNIYDEWAPFADRQTIVFAPSIDYANGLVHPDVGDSFYARGINAKVVSSRLKQKDRDAVIQEFRDGELKVLVSVDMLREGFDCPAASCAIDLQPNAQLRTYWQKIGRVKRPHENQSCAVYIDMAGNSWKFPHPDDDPSWPTGEESTQDVLEREYERGDRQRVVRCPKCGAVYKPQPRCPECKYERKSTDCVRVIRMGNGKLREVKAHETRKKQKTEAQRRSDDWKSMLFRGLAAGLTLKQCVGMCKGKYGFLPYGLPCVPEKGSASWNMKVEHVYDKAGIMREFDK